MARRELPSRQRSYYTGPTLALALLASSLRYPLCVCPSWGRTPPLSAVAVVITFLTASITVAVVLSKMRDAHPPCVCVHLGGKPLHSLQSRR